MSDPRKAVDIELAKALAQAVRDALPMDRDFILITYSPGMSTAELVAHSTVENTLAALKYAQEEVNRHAEEITALNGNN